jgi:prepilin-type N-terminal cleavage/methylation domain-containing protein
MTPRRRAFSLIEVLVSLAVFTLITGVIATVFVVSHRYTRLYHQVSQAQREAVVCVREMSRELVRGRCETLAPSGGAVNATWFLSNQPLEGSLAPAEFSPQGAVLWHKWVGLWCRPDGDVRRAEIALTGVAQPYLQVDLTSCPSLISDFTALPRYRRLASHINRFEIRGDSNMFTIDVLSESHNAGNPPTRYRLSSSFFAQ